jgi:hypothetical protein
MHLQYDGGEQAKHGDQAQSLDQGQRLAGAGAQVEEGNLEDMTGFKSRAKDNARRVFVLARVVMDWFGLR